MPQTQSSSNAPALLFAAGGLLVAAAAGVAGLGALGQAALASSLATAGVTPGLLGLGGLCMLGLGAAAKASSRSGQDAGVSAEQEALAREVAGLRQQFEEVRQQQAQILAIGQAGGQFGLKPVAEQTNAIFRIAASLDQLGAKLDNGFKSHFATVDEKLNILARVLAEIRGGVQSAPSAPAPQAAAPAPQPAPSAPRQEPRPAPARPQAAPAQAPRAPLPTRPAAPPSLGILDQLGDHSTGATAHSAPAPAAQPRAPQPQAAAAQPAAAPANSNEPTIIDMSADESAPEKPAPKSGSSLDALLPDDSVRRALGS